MSGDMWDYCFTFSLPTEVQDKLSTEQNKICLIFASSHLGFNLFFLLLSIHLFSKLPLLNLSLLSQIDFFVLQFSFDWYFGGSLHCYFILFYTAVVQCRESKFSCSTAQSLAYQTFQLACSSLSDSTKVK